MAIPLLKQRTPHTLIPTASPAAQPIPPPALAHPTIAAQRIHPPETLPLSLGHLLPLTKEVTQVQFRPQTLHMAGNQIEMAEFQIDTAEG